MLDYLDARSGPVRLKDVVTDLGYPLSSASAGLKSIFALGFLNYNRNAMGGFDANPEVRAILLYRS